MAQFAQQGYQNNQREFEKDYDLQFDQRRISDQTLTQNALKRKREIIEEFKEIDVDKDKNLSFQEICQFLDKKQGSKFDRNLITQLFNLMDKNHDNVISTEEFTHAYAQVEDDLKNKIQALEQDIKYHLEQKQENEKKLAEQRGKEQLIPGTQIMVGSMLTVNVIEAKDLQPMDLGNVSDPYVVLICGNQKEKTAVIDKTLNPFWNQTFTFQIKSEKEELRMEVWDHDRIGSDDFEGQITIPLEMLRDQMRHDEWFDLVGMTASDKAQGQIHVILHWIWSLSKYYDEVIKQWNIELSSEQVEVNNLRAQLQKLQEPFGLTSIATTLKLIAPQEGAYVDKVDQTVKQWTGQKYIHWGRQSFYVTCIYLLLTVLVMFIRPDFPNLMIAICAMFVYFLDEVDKQDKYRKLAGGILIVMLYDIIWLSLYASHWFSGFQRDEGIENRERAFCVILSLLNLLFKIIIGIIYWINSVRGSGPSINVKPMQQNVDSMEPASKQTKNYQYSTVQAQEYSNLQQKQGFQQRP